MNTIELTDKQMKVVTTALEVYDRMNGGQVAIAIGELIRNPDFGVNIFEFNDTKEDLELSYSNIFPVGDPRSHIGVGCWYTKSGNENANAMIARNIAQTFRQELAFRDYPPTSPHESLFTQYLDPPPCSEPTPKITPKTVLKP